MTEIALDTSPRRGPRALAFPFLAWIVTTILTVMIGPFGTFDSMMLPVRIGYWGGIIGSAIVVSIVIREGMERLLGRDSIRTDLAGSAVMSCVFGPAICVFNVAVMETESFSPGMLVHHVSVVLMVCLGVVLTRHWLRESRRMVAEVAATAVARIAAQRAAEAAARSAAGARARAVQAAPVAAPVAAAVPVPVPVPVPDVPRPGPSGAEEPAAALLRRLSLGMQGARILRVSADDHYLCVQTSAGAERVLMRLGDALEALADLPGTQVHRSHWVAFEAVAAVRAEGRRHVAVLADGSTVPVSRSYLPDLRKAGLLGAEIAT